jgi:hypothetical protein
LLLPLRGISGLALVTPEEQWWHFVCHVQTNRSAIRRSNFEGRILRSKRGNNNNTASISNATGSERETGDDTHRSVKLDHVA